MNEFYVEVVQHPIGKEPESVAKVMGPMSERAAERVAAGVSINLNHTDYFVRIRKNKP